jgi:hypothetical protein
MDYEEKIKELYKEYREKKAKGIEVDVEMYKRRKRALMIASEIRNKKNAKAGERK